MSFVSVEEILVFDKEKKSILRWIQKHETKYMIKQLYGEKL